MTTGLSLVARKNIRDEFENKKGALESIFSSALGATVTVGPVDFVGMVAELEKWGKENGQTHDWKDRVGEGAFKVIAGFSNNISEIASDDMIKEAILEKMPKHQISFKLVPNLPEEADYNCYSFEDGVLFLTSSPNKGWPTNVASTGRDLEKFL
jgi:hypothetical protein